MTISPAARRICGAVSRVKAIHQLGPAGGWISRTSPAPKLRTVLTLPSGSPSGVRMAASFEFAPESDKIVCERPYFDQGAVVRALGL